MSTRGAVGNIATYRPDIDGLRAVAVLLVVIYHANFTWLPGGYVGVDVFFVISGYLISNLLINEIGSGSFTFSDFYLRRIRRLAPAAAVVILACSIWFSGRLYPQEYQDFGGSLLAFLALGSNWYFLKDVGYFSPAAEIKPLLHTWSLGVEEQFYLIFPALFAFFLRSDRIKWKLAAVAVLALLSYLFGQYLLASQQVTPAFYNSFARFWELLAGCCLAVFFDSMRERIQRIPVAAQRAFSCNAMSFFGIALILYPAFLYTKGTVFPGINALPVVVGTIMVIASGPVTLVGRSLAFAPVRYIGKISYGFYLWHWPVFIGIQSLMPNSRGWSYIGIALAAVMSALTYHFIEQPIRERRVLTTVKNLLQGYALFYVAAFAVVCMALFPSFNYFRSETMFGELGKVLNRIHHERGKYLERVDVAFNGNSGSYELAKYEGAPCSFDDGNSRSQLDICLRGALGEHAYLLIGDSIGRDTLFALKKAFPTKRFAMLHQSSCIPVDTYDKVVGKNCFQGLGSLLEPLLSERRIDGIILASRVFPEQVPAYSAGIASLGNAGVPLVVIAGTPAFMQEIDYYVVSMYKAYRQIPMGVETTNFSVFREGQDQIVQRLREGALHVPFVDVYQYRCSNSECPLFLNQDALQPIIFDREHLTLEGIDWLSRKLAVDKAILHFMR